MEPPINSLNSVTFDYIEIKEKMNSTIDFSLVRILVLRSLIVVCG